eukprot:1158335-Pelagomonas_calceolata.AAC.17
MKHRRGTRMSLCGPQPLAKIRALKCWIAVKKGPLQETSPMLCDISHVPHWAKVGFVLKCDISHVPQWAKVRLPLDEVCRPTDHTAFVIAADTVVLLYQKVAKARCHPKGTLTMHALAGLARHHSLPATFHASQCSSAAMTWVAMQRCVQQYVPYPLQLKTGQE